MTDYMKCGDGPFCPRCRHNHPVTPVGVRYLRRNALDRCDYFAENDKCSGERRATPHDKPVGMDGV